MDTENNTVYMFRKGGQWKIEITMPQWIIDDILRDCELQDRVAIMLFPEYGGSSYYGSGKTIRVLAMALFEETNVEISK